MTLLASLARRIYLADRTNRLAPLYGQLIVASPHYHSPDPRAAYSHEPPTAEVQQIARLAAGADSFLEESVSGTPCRRDISCVINGDTYAFHGRDTRFCLFGKWDNSVYMSVDVALNDSSRAEICNHDYSDGSVPEALVRLAGSLFPPGARDEALEQFVREITFHQKIGGGGSMSSLAAIPESWSLNLNVDSGKLCVYQNQLYDAGQAIDLKTDQGFIRAVASLSMYAENRIR